MEPDDGICEPLPVLVRVRFFAGQRLTPEDLAREQTYQREKSRLLNRALHGSGVADGLQVAPDGAAGIVVGAGLALDGCGREIVVPCTQRLGDPRQPADHTGAPCGARVDADVVTLCLEYAESPESPVPTPDGTEYSRVREGFCLRPLPGDLPAVAPGVALVVLRWAQDGALKIESRATPLAPPGITEHTP
jgi:hypothetical protein